MKFINTESRHPIYLDTDIPEWQTDYTMDEKLGSIKMMGNVQLREVKEIAEFNRLEVQLRIYGLEKADKGYEEETFLLKRINNHIENIDKLMAKNAKDNYWTWNELEDEE